MEKVRHTAYIKNVVFILCITDANDVISVPDPNTLFIDLL